MSVTPDNRSGVETVDVETSTGGVDDGGWRTDVKGRKYVPREGRSGVIYQQGGETVEEARVRDAKGPSKDRQPKTKRSKPPAPTRVDLKQLEWKLTEALRSPSMIAAMAGDKWVADHFYREAPNLARNLTTAAEHNPWLRAKLEASLAGEELLVKVITILGVGGALVAYAVPPLAYYNVLPFIGKDARELFGVPDRAKLRAEQKAKREQEERDAEAAQAAQAPESGAPAPPPVAAAA